MTFLHFFELIKVKIIFNLKAESGKSYLSYGWWLLEPILHMSVYYVVFGILLNRGMPNFVAFLLCGLIPWLWFSKTINNATASIIQGKVLMNQVSLPKIFFPLVVIGQDLVKQVFVVVLLLTFLYFYGITPSKTWLWLPLVLFVQLLLTVPLTFLVAGIVPFIPDFRHIIGTGLQLLMFSSGIFYSYSQVLLPEHQKLFLFNPIANLIENYRTILINGGDPDLVSLFIISVFSILITIIALFIYKKLDSVYPRIVIE